MTEKRKGLLADVLIYAAAFALAAIPFFAIGNIYTATAAFTATATAAVFVASCALSDVSVYDPYWSVAPPVMLIFDMAKYRLWNYNCALLLLLVGLWSLRLTANWYSTYRGIGHEDWRYARYRAKYGTLAFHAISFVGLHFVPTVVVYLGLCPAIAAVQTEEFSPLSLVGAAIMLAAVWLELVSDRAIHRFLAENAGARRTCDVSVWRYSRHPNYLGEISFWFGIFIYLTALDPGKAYLGVGALSIAALFLFVSIPMMERHNAERREDYAEYREKTSMLFLMPRK